MHYYQFNIGDYSSHTRRLSPMEDLAYRRILDEYYLHERPLNACSTHVSRQIGLTENEKEVKYVLDTFFILTPEGFVNKRADLEISKYHGKLENAVKAGKASAAKRTLNDRSTTVQQNINQETRNKKQETRNINQEPRTINQEPVQKPKTLDVAVGTRPHKKTSNPKTESKSSAAWAAYSNAFFKRYGVEPVRNSKTNALLCQLVDRLGYEEAPFVAEFYLQHNQQFYVQKMHPVGLLVSDAEKLRAEWFTGNKITATRANQIDKTQTNYDSWAPLLTEAREKDSRLAKEKENEHE